MPGNSDRISLTRDHDYDVMAIGAASAGLMAAINAAAQGANVCLLEADSKPGASTTLAHGLVLAANTEILRQHGADFNAEQSQSIDLDRSTMSITEEHLLIEEGGG